MPRGAKPGERRGGRQVGVPNRKTQELVAQSLRDGITPIEVMIKNMRFWHESAEDIANKLRDLVVDVEDPEQLQKLFKAIDMMNHYRENAESCAVDAAPYMHPKLAAITFKGDAENPIALQIKAGMTPKEAAEAYASTVDEAPK